jgi:hypothetical protein
MQSVKMATAARHRYRRAAAGFGGLGRGNGVRLEADSSAVANIKDSKNAVSERGMRLSSRLTQHQKNGFDLHTMSMKNNLRRSMPIAG